MDGIGRRQLLRAASILIVAEQEGIAVTENHCLACPTAGSLTEEADDKTNIQGRRRKHRSLPPAPGRPIYVEHEYARAGALAYLAAWDVQRAKLFGRCERKNGIAAFARLIVQVMLQTTVSFGASCVPDR